MGMKKSSKFVDIYTPNKNVLVTVTNTPQYEDEVFTDYFRTVTIKIKVGRDKDQLKFKRDEDIAKFVETIDFEEPQTSLDFAGGNAEIAEEQSSLTDISKLKKPGRKPAKLKG